MNLERLEKVAKAQQQEKERGDKPIFEGGPTESQVESWKRQFNGNVYLTAFSENEVYIWRTLDRYEYKIIAAQPNTDPLMREEMICEMCVLWPENFNYEKQAKTKAGTVSVLAEQIMEASNFTRTVIPQRL